MMNKATIFGAIALVAGLGASSTQAAQLLLNGSFEGPVVASGGNNLGSVPTSWTVTDANNVVTPGVSNLTRGVVTNGSTTGTAGASNLPLDPFDAGSAQSLDISGDGKVYQLFTAQFNTPVTVKIDFGGRDSGSAAGPGSYWTIFNSTGTTLIASSSANPVKPAFNTWVTQTLGSGVSLIAGTQYRFVITLDNPDHVDGVSITQVPEPTTFAAVGIGAALLGWVGIKRRRRS